MKEAICYLLILIAACYFGYQYAMTPVVYWSTSEDKCVKIEIDGEVFDCSNLPENYERIWVK